MRYIGNKTRLLPFLTEALSRLGIPPGTAHDAFAGTASVGRALKEAGWRVMSSDIMTYSYVLQRAYVVAQRPPSLRALVASDAVLRRALSSPALRPRAEPGAGRLAQVAAYCSALLPPAIGFISEHFSPHGASGRMYFTPDNAARLDAARSALHDWHSGGLIDDHAFNLLLAALLEGADRVANTAGVYAAYMKSWQPNALRPLELQVRHPVRGRRGSRAFLGDAARVAAELGEIDLLYVDPPYNSRQYAGYYHVPEIIARGWFDKAPTLTGRTGLLAGHDLKSDWCSAARVRGALAELLSATRAKHVVVSYNSEGLIPEPELCAILAQRSVDGHVRSFRKPYRRYRADSDHARRSYRGDAVEELLYHVRMR